MWQRKYNILFLTMLVVILMFVPKIHAQMMGNFYNQSTDVPTQQDLQDIQTGKDLYNKLQAKQATCSQLKNDDFEKIGEHIMNQRFGNTQSHIQMNNTMKQMMGNQGEENMHIKLGMIATGCDTNLSTKEDVSK